MIQIGTEEGSTSCPGIGVGLLVCQLSVVGGSVRCIGSGPSQAQARLQLVAACRLATTTR